MKREIIFRGKRVDNGEWVCGDLIHDYIHHKSGLSIVNGGGCVWHEVIPETVGQFIGHLDKDGKEICDGDIVLGMTNVRAIGENYTDPIKGTVQWDTSDTGFFIDNEDFRYPYIKLYHADKIEVIGNIHDNPDLL